MSENEPYTEIELFELNSADFETFLIKFAHIIRIFDYKYIPESQTHLTEFFYQKSIHEKLINFRQSL